MNSDQIKGNWKLVGDEIKRTWGKLSEDDLTAIAGRRDHLAGMLQSKYGYTKGDAENRVDQLVQRLRL